LSTEVLKHSLQLVTVIVHHVLSQLKVFLVVRGLDLSLNGVGHQFGLEHVVQLVSKSWQVRAIVVLNVSSSYDCFEELSLKHNFGWPVDVFSLNAKLFDEGSIILLLLSFVVLAEIVFVINILHDGFDVIVATGLAIDSVNQVELADLV
jgi:hypothetical protein